MNQFVRFFFLALWLLLAPTTWATQFAYISNSLDNTVSVISPETNTVIATVPVGSSPFGVAVAPAGPAAGDVYVTNSGSNTVSVINPVNTVIATVPVGSSPFGVAVSPVGPEAGDVYVTNSSSNTVSVINPTTNTVIATVSVGSSPFGVAVAPAGPEAGDVYVTNSGSNTVSVINPATNTVIATVSVGSSPFGVAVSPVGPGAGDVYVTNSGSNTVSVISPVNTVIATVSVGSGPFGVAVAPAGPAAGDVHVTNSASNTVSLINSATNTVIATVPVGSGSGGVAITSDGLSVYVANKNSNAVSVIATATETVVSTVPSGGGPIAFGQFIGGVSQADTTTAMTSSMNPSLFGQAIAFTATVSPVPPGAGTPTGTVTFLDGTTTICSAVTLSSGSASCVISTLATGFHSITAAYSGDTNNAPSSNMLPQEIYQATSSTSVSSSNNPSTFKQPVTFTATVSGQYASGAVTYNDGATVIPGCHSAPLFSGSATCLTSSLAVGSHSITAVYSGDSNYTASSSSTLTQQVNPVTSSTILVSSVNPSTFAQGVTFTATVSGQSPTGTVMFSDGATVVCSATTLNSGSASCPTSTLTAGSHSMTAVYSGDTNNATSTSNAVAQQVNTISTTTSLATSCMTTFVENQPFTMTATVSGAAPNGDVSFATQDNVVVCANVPLSSGSADCTTNALSVAGSATEQAYSLTANYGGDINNTSSTSAAIIVLALKASDVVFRNDFEMRSLSCPVE